MRSIIGLILRLRGRAVNIAFMPDNDLESERVMAWFIAIGHGYGIDFGNIDPAWYRKP